ncbi:MAG: DMT family transporter [Chloroflexi bacterium]|nr:DMT family transporter [Chloroflexota bacterium]
MTDRSRDGSSGLAGAGLVVLAAVCFGTLGPVTRFADDAGVGSLAIVAWRAAIGASVMLLLLLSLRQIAGRRPLGIRAIQTRDRWFIGTASMANLVLNLAMFIAFVRIEIGLALLVFYSYPAFVAIASVLWFGDRLDPVRWGALGLAMFGLVLTLTGSGDLGQLDALGIGLSFLAALTQAFYVLAARHGFARIPPIESAALTMGGAALGYVVIATATGQLSSLAAPVESIGALWPVLVAGFVGAAIPTLAFITGIRMLGAPRAAILATLEPVVGVALAAWLLGEQPGATQLIGGALILVAAVVLQLGGQRPSVAEHEAVAT